MIFCRIAHPYWLSRFEMCCCNVEICCAAEGVGRRSESGIILGLANGFMDCRSLLRVGVRWMPTTEFIFAVSQVLSLLWNCYLHGRFGCVCVSRTIGCRRWLMFTLVGQTCDAGHIGGVAA